MNQKRKQRIALVVVIILVISMVLPLLVAML
jgi:hypothetical protein